MANDLILTKKGMELWLKWFTFQASPSGNRGLLLFKNNYTVGPVSVYANLTDATFGGYSIQNITTGYTAPAISGPWWASDAVTKYFPCISGAGLPQTIYGYGVIEAGTDLMWAETFPTPQVISAPGQAIALTHTDRIRGLTVGSGGSPAVMSNFGLEEMLKVNVGVSRADFSFNVGIFTNSPTITPATVTSDFTEPGWSGYARQSSGAFGAPSDTSAPPSIYQMTTVAGLLDFTPTAVVGSPETANGYFVVGASTGNLYWSQYISPVVESGAPSFLAIFPALNLRSYYIL